MDRKFKAIAFDLDGTLIDTEPFYRRLMAETLEQVTNYRLAKEEYDHYYFGKTTRQGFADILRKLWQRDATTSELDEIILKVRAHAAELRKSVSAEIFPGSIEALQWCRAHSIPIAIVTNASRINVETNRQWYYWDELIALADHFVSYSDVEHPKPYPDTYLRAAELMSVDPRELLVVEDTTHGAAAGRAAGAGVVTVNGLTEGGDYHLGRIDQWESLLPKIVVG